MKKYLLVGGHVFSNDGDRHYIPANRLVDLYGLNPRECAFAFDETDAKFRLLGTRPGDVIVLRPRSDGLYRENIKT